MTSADAKGTTASYGNPMIPNVRTGVREHGIHYGEARTAVVPVVLAVLTIVSLTVVTLLVGAATNVAGPSTGLQALSRTPLDLDTCGP
ncbi:MAG: hypothetical protein ACRD22_20825 [Terriglobia bacterium]